MPIGIPPRPLPPRLQFWTPKGRLGWFKTYVLPSDAYDREARKRGIDPRRHHGFTVLSHRWWVRDQVFLRASRLDLFAHEYEHVERRKPFHS
jgi:hypothetical protein